MPNHEMNREETFQKLRAEWGGMSESDKNAEILIAYYDWRWECWPSTYDQVERSCLVPPKDSDWEPSNYPHRLARPCGPDVERFSDWWSNPINHKLRQWGVPRFAFEHAPASLLSDMEDRAIKEVGAKAWLRALRLLCAAEIGEDVDPALVEIWIARVKPEQRAFACWLAKKMEGLRPSPPAYPKPTPTKEQSK